MDIRKCTSYSLIKNLYRYIFIKYIKSDKKRRQQICLRRRYNELFSFACILSMYQKAGTKNHNTRYFGFICRYKILKFLLFLFFVVDFILTVIKFCSIHFLIFFNKYKFDTSQNKIGFSVI